jgi:hypothetical protein
MKVKLVGLHIFTLVKGKSISCTSESDEANKANESRHSPPLELGRYARKAHSVQGQLPAVWSGHVAPYQYKPRRRYSGWERNNSQVPNPTYGASTRK